MWHANGNTIDNTDGSTLYSFRIEFWKDCDAKPLNNTPKLGG